MQIMRGLIQILLLLAIVGSFQNRGYTQEILVPDEAITDSLPLYGRDLQYSIALQKGVLLEVILDIWERDFAVDLSLSDSTGNEEYIYNQGMNYPSFQGAYLLLEIPKTQTYLLHIRTAEDFDQRVDFTLIAHTHAGDEPDNRVIRYYDILEGVMGPQSEYDMFTMTMRKDSPVLLVATSPYNILDSVMGIISPDGEVVAYNDDFFGTASTLFYMPASNGDYTIILQGKYTNSVGPYRLIANPVPLYLPPFTMTDDIREPGDIFVYQIPVKANQVYDFIAYAVDEFYPLMALADVNQNVIDTDQATPNFPAAFIEGFTPLQDDTLYLYVMGDTTDSVGYFGLEVALSEDEEDGIMLEHGSAFQGIIGPIGDVDEFRFTAEEGMDYSLLVSPTQRYLDPAIRVLDLEGNEIFFNDDSADGIFSLLSGIVLPTAAEYRIQVMASPTQSIAQRLTGVYIIQLATGTTFDWGTPRIGESMFTIAPHASGVHITIPTSAVADDTYPLLGTLLLDQTGGEVHFTVEKGHPVELDIAANPYEVFFLTLTDSAARQNTLGPVTIPGPRMIADLEGMPTALAVDPENNLYVADSYIGGIVKYTIHGASEVILQGEYSQGGTLGPNAVGFDPSGTLFFSNAATHAIVKALPGGATETFATDLNFPVSFIFDPEGTMYLAQIGSDTIDKLHPDGTLEPYVKTIKNPTGLAFSPDGILHVCNSVVGGSGIYRIKTDGSSEVFVEPFTDSLSGMAFDRDGYLYVTDEDLGYLYRISPEGERIIFTQDIGATAGLAFGYGDSARTLFVSSQFYLNDPYRTPFYYEQRLIAIPTGRLGLPVPGAHTAVDCWMMF